MRNIFRSLLLASIALAAAAVISQPAMAAATLNVEFPFTVGTQVCPAGHYQVVRDPNAATIRLIGPTQSFTWGIHPGDGAPSDTRVMLKFDGAGSARVLSAIQYGSLTTSRLDSKSLGQEAHSSEIVLGR